jgi:hypothetical protein
MYGHTVHLTVRALAIVYALHVFGLLSIGLFFGRSMMLAEFDRRLHVLRAANVRLRTRLACAEEELRHRRLDDEDEQGPDTTVDTDTEEPVAPARARFAWDTVRKPATDLAEVREVFADAHRDLWVQAHAIGEHRDWDTRVSDLIAAAAPGHFVSDAIDDEITAILAAAQWGRLDGGELTEALVRQRVGMPTGQYPVVQRREPVGAGRPVAKRKPSKQGRRGRMAGAR